MQRFYSNKLAVCEPKASHRSRRPVFSTALFAACLTCVFLASLSARLLAAEPPSDFRARTVAIVGATVIPEPGKVIESGTVILRDGLIVDVGGALQAPASAEVIEGDGLYVYAGFIDTGATDLLDEERKPKPQTGRAIDFTRYALAATRPDNRKGLTPEFRAADGLKRDEELLDAARELGFTAIHVLPQGRIASGQGALVATGAAPLRESLMLATTFDEFELSALRGDGYPATLMGATAHLRQAFLDAGHSALHRQLYDGGAASVDRPAFDPALTALQRVASKQSRSIFFADTRDDIHRALNFSREHDLAPVLWGAAQAHRALERLKDQNISLVLQLDFGEKPQAEKHAVTEELVAESRVPLRVQQDKLDRWMDRVRGLSQLRENQVRFAFGSHKLKSRDKLLESVRIGIEEGLSPDAALAALTTDAAAIIGIDQRLGSISPGKLAHLVVMTGPFEDKKSKVRHLFIEDERFEYNKEAEGDSPESGDAAQVAGTWKLQIDSADGKLLATLEINVDGAKLKGTFESEQGDGRLISGSSTEDGIEFVVGIGAGDRQMELEFTATLQDNVLTGQLKPAFGAATAWTATRQQPDDPPDVEVAGTEDQTTDGDDPAVARADALPTEIEEDRLRRSLQTGGSVLIRGATVLTGTRQTLQDTSILVRDGKIAAIGVDLEPDDGMTVIDAANRFVMPGIIDTHSHIMITAGINEATQSIVPEVSIKDVVNSDDPSEYRALAGGVTAARLFHGSANVVGGQDAVVKLKYGAPAHEHILFDVPQGVKFALGENVKFRQGRFPNTRLGVEATLNRAFLEAVDYRRSWQDYERKKTAAAGASAELHLLPPRRDLRLEALADIVNHEKFIHSHCYRADEILMLLRVTSNLGIRVWSLQHVLEGYKIAPEIVAHGASCSTFSDWWAYKVEAFDATPYNAALLHEAGANVVIKSDNSELIRHLNQEAAKTVRYGSIPPDDALQAVTLNPARELGIDNRVGSIEVGKDADLAVFNTHPLSSFARCEMTLIDGEVYFQRKDAVTAMLPEAIERSQVPEPLVLPPADVRNMKLALDESPSGRYAIVGATLHPIDGPEVADGTLLIDGGTIAALGPQLEVPGDAKLIEAHGLHVWPGLIESGTTLGLVEIGRVRETHDFSEGGEFQPDIRAGVALNPDSELIPAARAGGITTILVRPTGGIVSGQASLAKLGGWTAPEMIVELEAGLQINWPNKAPSSRFRRLSEEDLEKARKKAEESIDQLRDFLEQTRLYDKLRKQTADGEDSQQLVDPRLEALRPYVNREKPVFIEADSRQQIAEALLFAEQEDLRIIISGGADAWKLADELKARNVPVIVGPVMRRPLESHDPYDAPYANPGRLHAAGVPFCIRVNNAANSRNAPFEAAMAVAYGLPQEAALRAVTLSAAEILGIDDRVGSLTVGKLANLVIADGSPLQPTTQIKGTFIEGTPYEPTSRQTRFYERYRSRLHKVRAGQGEQTEVTGEGE